MSYEPKLAAALSGATLRQLSHWRSATGARGAVLVPGSQPRGLFCTPVDPMVRGGEPVIEGTRIPASEVAALLKDGVPPESIKNFYPGVSPAAALDAADFTAYVDSYSDEGFRKATA